MERILALALLLVAMFSGHAFAAYETLSAAIDLRQLVPTAKCDGAADDSAALAKADAMVKIGAIGIYATCRLSSDLTLTHALYIGAQGALSIDTGKTLTVANLASDSAAPFPGLGTVVPGANSSSIQNLNQITVNSTAAGILSATDTFLNKVVIPIDSANAGGNNVWGLAINETCCTSAAKGQRFLLGARLDITGASNAADPLPAYIAVFGNTRVRNNIAAPNGAAGVWSANFNSELGTNATGWAELQGLEADVTAKAGSSVIRKVALSIVQGPADAVHGTSTDAAIGLYNAPGASAPWNNIIDLDNATAAVISTTGAIIHTRSAVTFADVVRLNSGTTITNGLNFTSATVTGSVILGPGASSFIQGDGTAFFNGATQGVGNLGAVYPSSLSGWALTTNFTGGEVDVWNTNNAGTGFYFRQKTGASAATTYGQLTEAGALGTTGLVIRVNNTGSGLSLQGVSNADLDSCGAGFRCLRTPN